MRLLSPMSLLWALPVFGAILLLYMLKLRRKDVTVPSVLLWSRAIRDVQANAPFQKLRRSLLLLLQLLLAALLTVALARPVWVTFGMGGRSIVLVMDTSASMAATDVRPNRMEAAKSEARKIVGAMRSGDQMTIVSFARHAVAVQGYSSDAAVLRAAIDGLRPSTLPTDPRAALTLASALVGDRAASRIDVVTDLAFPSVTGVDPGRAELTVHRVGKRGENVGIIGVTIQAARGAEQPAEAVVTLANTGRTPRRVTLEVTVGDSLIEAREVDLPQGEERAEAVPVPSPTEPQPVVARIDGSDDLAADDTAYAILAPIRTIRVLLVTPGNGFLEAALGVDGAIAATKVAPSGAGSAADADVIILDGACPSGLPAGARLYAACEGAGCPSIARGALGKGPIIDTDREHPVLRHVSFGTAQWASLRAGSPEPWAREIASCESGPAIIAGETRGRRALWTAFGLSAADGAFPVTVAYPVFVSDAVRWLAHADEEQRTLATGTIVRLAAPQGVKHVTVRRPDGEERTRPVGSDGAAVLADADVAGIYRASLGAGKEALLAFSLTDPTESDITPRKSLGVEGPGSSGSSRRVRTTHNLWRWLAAAAIVLLLFEWWVFHRRAFVR